MNGRAGVSATPQQKRGFFYSAPMFWGNCLRELVACTETKPRRKLAAHPNAVVKKRMKRGSWGLHHPLLCCFAVLIKMGKLDALPLMDFATSHKCTHMLGAWTA
eukprot:14406594-Ditylum_brightwellii.AAC.1